jgi:hypothetical protein
MHMLPRGITPSRTFVTTGQVDLDPPRNNLLVLHCIRMSWRERPRLGPREEGTEDRKRKTWSKRVSWRDCLPKFHNRPRTREAVRMPDLDHQPDT